MAAYTKPQQKKKEGSEKLRGEGDPIKFIDLRFERRQYRGNVPINSEGMRTQ